MYDSSFSLFGTRCLRVLDEGVCELDRGHEGDHLPFVPGGYLPPPLITPLDLLRWEPYGPGAVCLLCGQRIVAASCEGPTLTFREGDDQGLLECEWRFGPCGCVGREILTQDVA